jgi:hypothetical protein
MELEEQVTLIFNFLYSDKDEFVSINTIVESLNHKINRREVERILDDSRFNFFLDEKFAMIEGIFESDTKLYSLNSYGIEWCKKSWEKRYSIQEKKDENPFPEIFTGARGFKIFERFRVEEISKPTEYADYSLLFKNLMNDEFIHDMKQFKFIRFLDDIYKIEFTKKYNQFKTSNNPIKLKAYSRIKKLIQY